MNFNNNYYNYYKTTLNEQLNNNIYKKLNILRHHDKGREIIKK